MYLVSGATGQVGKGVARTLLAQGEQVRVFVRSTEKGAAWAKQGADVAVGTFEDVRSIVRALDDVRAAFLMQPNDFASTEFVEDGRKRADGYLQALRAAGSPQVVLLSSVGAQHVGGHGPIRREHLFEQQFSQYAQLSVLRAAYFMENWANVLQPVQGAGVVPTFLTPGRSLEMVSVADIGAEIGALMTSNTPQRIELAGPEPYTPEDVAAAFATLLGRSINIAAEDTAGVVPLFTSLGFSTHIAELVAEMYRGYADGTMAFEGTPKRGGTSLQQALAELIA